LLNSRVSPGNSQSVFARSGPASVREAKLLITCGFGVLVGRRSIA
jgi:hypothetical protein